jgi:hypothetical protein
MSPREYSTLAILETKNTIYSSSLPQSVKCPKPWLPGFPCPICLAFHSLNFFMNLPESPKAKSCKCGRKRRRRKRHCRRFEEERKKVCDRTTIPSYTQMKVDEFPSFLFENIELQTNALLMAKGFSVYCRSPWRFEKKSRILSYFPVESRHHESNDLVRGTV